MAVVVEAGLVSNISSNRFPDGAAFVVVVVVAGVAPISKSRRFISPAGSCFSSYFFFPSSSSESSLSFLASWIPAKNAFFILSFFSSLALGFGSGFFLLADGVYTCGPLIKVGWPVDDGLASVVGPPPEPQTCLPLPELS